MSHSPSNALHELPWLPAPPADFGALCKALSNQPEEFGVRLAGLASTALDENQLARLARVIQAARSKGFNQQPLAPFRLAFIGNGTSDFIAPALAATAPRHGIALDCIAGGYGQAVQEALNPVSAVNRFQPDAVLIALDWRGLPFTWSPGQPSDDTIAAVLAHIEGIRNGFRASGNHALCILQNLAAPPERFLGSFDRVLAGGSRQLIDRVNRELADRLRNSGDVLFDVAGLAETVGLENWHSPSEWNIAKLPFAQAFLPLYADHVCRIIAALRGKSRRCLVLDLDNTLWGGVIGDDGLNGIQLAEGDAAGEAYLTFQRYLLALRDHGILLAVSSKNEDAIARSPFREHPEMLLREHHIAVFQADWSDKPSNLQAIANHLSLGLGSLVFVDDNPVERQLVRKTLPEVAVPEMPVDPAWYARTLSAAGYFEAVAFSAEDSQRAGYYQANAVRAVLRQQVGDLDAYLATLGMEIWFQPFDELNRVRITQLINKSNQFNLTTRRYSEADVARMQDSPEYFTLQVRLKDSFGDNGIISVVICYAASAEEWEIDTWLMSCRVLGRRVENMVLRELLEHAAQRGIRRLTGVYIPTNRNRLVENHYRNLGFAFCGESPGGGSTWSLDVASASVEEAPMVVHSSLYVHADI